MTKKINFMEIAFLIIMFIVNGMVYFSEVRWQLEPQNRIIVTCILLIVHIILYKTAKHPIILFILFIHWGLYLISLIGLLEHWNGSRFLIPYYQYRLCTGIFLAADYMIYTPNILNKLCYGTVIPARFCTQFPPTIIFFILYYKKLFKKDSVHRI